MVSDNGSVIIVALPEAEDPVWKYSSEEIPHMTIAYLSDQMENLEEITRFVEHASSLFQPFYMSVDRRGTLGPNEADVLFFEDDGMSGRIDGFRKGLIQNTNVARSYLSVDQYPVWTPHLTMGYPEKPAKTDDREYPGFHGVRFDRIAIWAGNYDGPEFRLKREDDMPMSDVVSHARAPYDPVKRKQYYEEHKKLKGRDDGAFKSKAVKSKAAPDGPTNKHRTQALGALAKRNLGPEQRKAVNEETRKTKAALGKLTEDFRSWVNEHPNATPEQKNAQRAKVLDQKNELVKQFKDRLVKIAAKDTAPKSTALPFKTVRHDAIEAVEDFLEHHGIKGMKWGVRRRRSDDGTVTGGLKGDAKAEAEKTDAPSGGGGSSGAKKATEGGPDNNGDGQSDRLSADAERALSTVQKAPSEMSTREMREAVERARQVEAYNKIFNPESSNDPVQARIDELRKQSELRRLEAENTPPSKVKKFIAGSAAGYNTYKKLDEASGGRLSDGIAAKLGLQAEKSAAEKIKEQTDMIRLQNDLRTAQVRQIETMAGLNRTRASKATEAIGDFPSTAPVGYGGAGKRQDPTKPDYVGRRRAF